MITLAQLKAAMPVTGKLDTVAAKDLRCEEAYPHLVKTFETFDILTPVRMSCFLAQVGHECGSFRYREEIADGSAYEGRKDLGNNTPGDGKLYKGRGWVQVTGKYNYALMSEAFDFDFLSAPHKLAEYPYCAESAGVFWDTNKLNRFADALEFDKLTKRINGGFNGKADRDARWVLAKRALGI